MKNIFKPIRIIVCACIIAALPVTFAHAASDVASKIAQTKETVQKLLEIKDDTSISQEEKDSMELRLKKSITASIIDIAASQLSDARKQVDEVQFPESEDWNTIKVSVYDALDAYDAFYKDAKKKIEENDLTLEDIQTIAQEIEEKKNMQIDPFLEKTANIPTAFGIGDIIKKADERREKVASDVDKVYAQKLVTDSSLQESYQKASQAVINARNTNNKAKSILLNLYDKDDTATTTATSTQEEEKLDVELKDTIRRSAEYIKQAYSIFLEMSIAVKHYIQE